ncbi:MAG: hypothetical protein UHM23_08795 [Clostridia bacterium]|nr:hypothetical protein [Clostridia bacterium]
MFEEMVKIGVNEIVEKGNKRKEELENSEILSVNEEKGRAAIRTKNGTVIVKYPFVVDIPEEELYGYAVKCHGEFNEENIKAAKEAVLEELFKIIRDVAEAVPEKFFVIKDAETIADEINSSPFIDAAEKSKINDVDYFTVGCKLVLPNAYKGE